MKKTYITHVTRDYLEVALNLAKSVSFFSNLPLIVYCINLQEEDKQKYKKTNEQEQKARVVVSTYSLMRHLQKTQGQTVTKRHSKRTWLAPNLQRGKDYMMMKRYCRQTDCTSLLDRRYTMSVRWTDCTYRIGRRCKQWSCCLINC